VILFTIFPGNNVKPSHKKAPAEPGLVFLEKERCIEELLLKKEEFFVIKGRVCALIVPFK
jgi:hypothetical protein